MEFFKRLGKFKLLILVSTGVLVAALIIFLSFSLVKPDMVAIYKQLSPEDSNFVSMRLQALGVPYSSSNDGNQILVPINRVLGLRMLLAKEGIPSSSTSVGYELFDKTDLVGASQFVNNINLARALEGELSRTIANLSQIESARVHIVLPKKELFSKIGALPSASVVIRVKSGQKLGKEEIKGISHLILTAVPDLKIDNLTIINQNGKPLKISDEEESEGGFSLSSIEYRTNIENRLKNAIEELLGRYIGFGRVQANVFADIDFDREVINTELYDPENQAIRSKKTSEEKENEEKNKDNISVANNIPNIEQETQSPSDVRNKSKSDEIVNYEISRTTKNRVVQWGEIKKLSVAVIVDGIYKVDENTEQLVYIDRTQEELNKLKALVIAAVGIDLDRGDKIEIANFKFANDDSMSDYSEPSNILKTFTKDARSIAQLLIVGVILVLAALLLIKPLLSKILNRKKEHAEAIVPELGEVIDMNKKREHEDISTEDKEISSAVSSSGGGNDDSIRSSVSESIRLMTGEKKHLDIVERLNKIAQENPEDVLALLRKWLYQNS